MGAYYRNFMRFSGGQPSHWKQLLLYFKRIVVISQWLLLNSHPLYVCRVISNMSHPLALERGSLGSINCKNAFLSMLKWQELCRLTNSSRSNQCRSVSFIAMENLAITPSWFLVSFFFLFLFIMRFLVLFSWALEPTQPPVSWDESMNMLILSYPFQFLLRSCRQ